MASWTMNSYRLAAGCTTAMASRRRILLFDLYGVIAHHQRVGTLAEMAATCHAPRAEFPDAY
jgi:putative hydrolase of the HAD superfamily